MKQVGDGVENDFIGKLTLGEGLETYLRLHLFQRRGLLNLMVEKDENVNTWDQHTTVVLRNS